MIVHADDLGLSEVINAAILDALASGVCTSTSVMVNGPAFQDAVARLRELDGPCVGVHLNLSEHAPLRPDALRALFPEGRLGPAAIEARPEHLPGVVAEWTAQVEAARAAGLHPTHLDSHQHVHWRPVLRRALQQVAAATGVPCARTMGAWRPEVHAVRALPQRLRAARFSAALRRGPPPLRTTDHFANATTFRALVEAGALPGGTVEVMAHPGNPASARYAEELAWLSGPWRPAGVELISWRQV